MNHEMTKYLIERFKETPGGLRAAGLLGKHKLSMEDMLLAVLSEVTEVVPHLYHDVLYSTERLCGEELWETFRYIGPRRAAGMILVYLVESGVVPLDIHETRSAKGPKRFVLSPKWKRGQPVTR